MKRKALGGFTLLEVLMAVAILGLGLTVLLGAQVGMFTNAKRAERLSLAVNVARCRMSELELELLTKGYPMIDQESEGDCCMNESSDEGFRCSWKIQRVELPEPIDTEGVTDGGLDLSTDNTGTFGPLMELQEKGPSALGETADLGTLAENFGAAASGTDGLVSMVMGMVYPSLKPMLEASIRKVVVTVSWKDGVREQKLVVTQFLTDPRQGDLEEEAGDAGALPPSLFGGTGTAGGKDGG